MASEYWPTIDGWQAGTTGVDPLTLPLDRFLNLVYYWATKDAAEEKDLDKFERQLWRPPVGVVPTQGPWTAEAESAAFAGLKAELGI